MRFTCLLACVLITVSPFAAHAAQSEAERYQACTALVSTNPVKALADAEKWLKKESKNMAALHCKAMSLFVQRKYADSTITLEKILKLYKNKKRDNVWLSIKAQTAKAYALADQFTKAEKHLSEAISWASESDKTADLLPLLQQRATLYQQQNSPLKAVNDLDYAISVSPTAELLLQRAELLMKMGKTASAKEDAEAVLKNNPTNTTAKALLQQFQKQPK